MSTDVSSPPQRFSVLTLLLVYLAFMFFGVVVVGVIYMVADQFLTKSSSNASMGFLIPMLAAMAMTSFWAKREGRPTSGRQWLVALLAALLTLALNGALIWYLATSGAVPGGVRPPSASHSPPTSAPKGSAAASSPIAAPETPKASAPKAGRMAP